MPPFTPAEQHIFLVISRLRFKSDDLKSQALLIIKSTELLGPEDLLRGVK